MKVNVYFVAGEPVTLDLADHAVVVIDVLRATSSIVEALVNGAEGIYPASSTEEAIKLASSLGREDTVLCGESKGLMIEGFDLGNSPREFAVEQVAGKRLVMTTTNGTRTFLMTGDATRVLACCFTNLDAVAQEVSDVGYLVVVCAGGAGLFSLEDAVCAGALLLRVHEKQNGEVEFNDAAVAAMELANAFRVNSDFLASTSAGQRLVEIGFREDLDLCAQIDQHTVVPEMDDRVIRVRLPEVEP